MIRLTAAPVLAALLVLPAASPALAATKLPPIKSSSANAVPECATPGRLMEMLKKRNSSLDAKFERIAVEYMRHGEALGTRWDYAFFQMLLETGNLSFRRGNGRPGDVSPQQNNFAGLGATGGGAPGESFSDVSTGVKAHLEHLMLYAGARIPNPTAERTRKVQEWGILESWQRKLGRDVTFRDMSSKWAPGSRGYPRDMISIADKFYGDYCAKPDPAPNLLLEARGISIDKNRTAEAGLGSALAQRAIAEARNKGNDQRQALGASNLAKAGAANPPIKVLNGADKATADSLAQSPKASSGPSEPIQAGAAKVQKASAAAAVAVAPPPTKGGKCKVWTASYGGTKSIIIRSSARDVVNYTVLDVNEASASREAEAYISAYAKGGNKIAEFSNHNKALSKAFEMCPEG